MAQKLLLNYVQGELEKGSVLSMNTATLFFKLCHLRA